MPDDNPPPSFTPWFRVYPDRFASERAELEAMGFILDEASFEKLGIVIFTGSLPGFEERKLTISFPAAYPWIHPDVADDGKCSLLRRHQLASTRAYCLYGPEGVAWYSLLNAVHALEETRKLIKDVLEESSDSSLDGDPYPEPFSAQAFFDGQGTVLVPPGISDFFPDDLTQPAEGMIQINYDAQPRGISRGVIVEAGFKNKDEKAVALKGYQGIVNGRPAKGRLTFLPTLARPILDGDGLVQILREHNVTFQPNYNWQAVIFPEQSGNRDAQRYSWLVFTKEGNGKFRPVRTITYRSSEKSARIPGLEFLAGKRIAVIGCGAIGSKIAASFASAGVCRFLLVDKEVMEPANSVRHECGVDYFAMPKVNAVAVRLMQLNPDSTDHIQMFHGDPFRYCSSKDQGLLHAALSQCDLIVNATGHPCITQAISMWGENLNVPSMHASITNGAWSGEVFRYVPGSSSCWQCFQDSFANSPPGEATPHGHVFAPGCDQPTFTGTGHELDIVAGLATSFAIDTLRLKDGQTTEYEGDYLLWEGRDAAGKLQLRTIVSPVPSRQWCPVCKRVA